MPVHHPRSCPQIRAFAVTAEAAGHGTIPLASRLRYVISQRKNFRKFIEKPREFIDISGNFRKFDIRGRSDRRFHHTGTPRSRADRNCGQMRGNAPVENGAGLPGEGPPQSGPTPQATPERPVSRHRNCGQMCPPRLARATARLPPSAPRSPPEKTRADGRPLQHTPSTRKPGDGSCGETRVAYSRRREANPDPQGVVEKAPRCEKTTVIPASEPTEEGGRTRLRNEGSTESIL